MNKASPAFLLSIAEEIGKSPSLKLMNYTRIFDCILLEFNLDRTIYARVKIETYKILLEIYNLFERPMGFWFDLKDNPEDPESAIRWEAITPDLVAFLKFILLKQGEKCQS